jgi:hypothetical protein
MSSSFSDIAAVCRLGSLSACCLVVSVLGLGPLCHCYIQLLILDVRPVGVLGALLSLTCLWSPCSFPRVTFALWVILILAGENSFGGPQLSWVPIVLTSVLFRHATFERRNTFLQAVADFLLDPLFPRVLSFSFWRRTAARFRTLLRFLGPPTGITAVSLRYLLMLLYGLHHFWIGLSLCRLVASGRLIQL